MSQNKFSNEELRYISEDALKHLSSIKNSEVKKTTEIILNEINNSNEKLSKWVTRIIWMTIFIGLSVVSQLLAIVWLEKFAK